MAQENIESYINIKIILKDIIKRNAIILSEVKDERDIYQRVENLNELTRQLSIVNQRLFALGYEEKG